MKTAILVAPVFDNVTEYSFSWSREIKELLESAGFNVIDISGNSVKREDVEKALQDNPNALYIHYDHGSEDGHWCSPVSKCIDLNNVKLLSGREVYTMNCLSAKRLGVQAWVEGCIAYYGYIKEFVFTTDSLEEFKTFANMGLKYRIMGYSWSDVIKIVKEEGKKLTEQLVSSGKIIASVILAEDVDALVCWNGEQPSEDITTCPFRKLAIRLFGKKAGWKITRKFAFGTLLYGIGLGVMLHDFAHECWELGGYSEILSPHGFYVGLIIAVIGYFITFKEYLKD